MNYVVITPVKDEELNFERTLESMTRQTIKPLRWVIVDDGSSDRTAEIAQRYADSHEFISLVKNESPSERHTGVAEILAFNAGYDLIRKLRFDCVVKLDGDLSFEESYFQDLLGKFRDNEKLGIASGVYLEQRGSTWHEIPMPAYHAAGASKMVRRECFDAFGGFVPQRGWDTVDEIRAMTLNWETAHFPELKLKHWKREGTGMGLLRTAYMHGEIYYRTGGSGIFLLLKVLKRLLERPIVIGSVALLWGYLYNMITNAAALVNEEEACYYRSLLHRRLSERLAHRAQSTT